MMNINISTYGTGQPLVLFHGWGFDSHIWSPLLPKLTQNYQLYLVDLPGFGLSSNMDWKTFKTLLLSALPDYFALIGWSMGGLFATRLAIEESERVTHLLNIASSPRFIKIDDWPGVDIQIFNTFYENLAGDPEQTLAQFVQLQLQGQTMNVISKQKRPTLMGLRTGLELLLNWDLRQSLHQLNKPTCYMFGRLDAIISRLTLPVMKRCYPDFKYVLFPKAVHIPFLSHPEQFITELNEFL